MNGARWGRVAAGFAVSGVCAWLVARRVEWTPLVAALRRVNVAWLVATVSANVAGFVMASLRWRRIVDRQVRLSRREAFESLMIGNFANLVMPTRLGDVMRAVLVARHGGVPAGALLASVVVERVADLVMLLAFAFSLSLVVPAPPVVLVAIRTLAAVTIGAIVCFMVAADRVAPIATAALRVVAPSLVDPIGRHVDAFVVELRAAGGVGRVAGVIALSALAWIVFGTAFVCAVLAFGFEMPLYAGFFVMAVVNLGGLVPASPGAIGVYHYLAVLALSVWLHDPSAALGFALVTHALGLLVVVASGSWSLVRQGLSLRTLPAAPMPVVSSPQHTT
jgi:glycosyltransferase 2 family protein